MGEISPIGQDVTGGGLYTEHAKHREMNGQAPNTLRASKIKPSPYKNFPYPYKTYWLK